MAAFVFVGERPSPKAAATGATWQNGRLAGRTLRDTLAAVGIDPDGQTYLTLWRTPGLGPAREPLRRGAIRELREARAEGRTVVALGALVAGELSRRRVPHVRMTHPAARGLIRKRERYEAHVRAILCPDISPP